MYLLTLVSPTSMPSLRSSHPCRGKPRPTSPAGCRRDESAIAKVFGQRRKSTKVSRADIYARVSKNDHETPRDQPVADPCPSENAPSCGVGLLPLQLNEVGSGASQRELREKFLDVVRRREIDVVLVWQAESLGPISSQSHSSYWERSPSRPLKSVPNRRL
jgi:hypothetical protein